jgi:2-polyprenyl-3-methyl-5-hydroxy-6-metoxy-1,4-benzoquinol methylase
MDPQTQSSPQIFEPEYYQRLYDIEENHWWAKGIRDAMVALLRQPIAGKQSLRVLDAGCGTGYLLNFLQQQYPLAGEPVGIDVSPHALQFCELRGSKELQLASVTEIPFADASFDLIICIDTIQHLAPAGADQLAIDEFARLLKPDGLLYLRTNSALGHPPLQGVDSDQYRRYDCHQVKEMLTAAGLTVERATYLNAIPSIPATIKEYLRAAKPEQHQTAAIGPGLAIQPPLPRPSFSSSLMYGTMKFEAWLIGSLHLDLPFGHSSGFVARRLAKDHTVDKQHP